MEYEDSGAVSNAQLDKESSLSLTSCRELIELVRRNEVLWKKRCVSSKDQETKTLAWRSIGNGLSSLPTGTDAEKEFYKLRQKFGREFRKEKESAIRSGAGAPERPYNSDWPLYKDLEFLKDVIKPRQSFSNPARKMVWQRPSRSPSPPATAIENSQSCSYVWNSDIECSLLSGSEEDNTMPVHLVLPSSAGSSKQTVPASDSFYNKKRRLENDVAVALIRHSSNLNMLTDHVKKQLETPAVPERQAQDPLFLCISAALEGVEQSNRLPCIIEVLQVIQKYTTKK